jgi:subtilisin family serine protease
VRTLILLLILILLISPLSTRVGTTALIDKATWIPSRIELTVFPGSTQALTIQLRTNVALQNASIFVAPEIAKFVFVETSGLNSVLANQDYEFPLTVNVPISTLVGNYEGTIHLRDKQQTVPATLKVVIHVIAPSSTLVPTGITEPSADRITRDADGQKVVKDEIIVILNFDTVEPQQRVAQIATVSGGVIIGAIASTLTYQLRFNVTDLLQLEQIRLFLQNMADVDSASHHFLADGQVALNPNDSEYDSWDENNPNGNNWNLEFIKAPSAWEMTQGDPSVVVGVVDADLDRRHGDLNDNVISMSGTRTTAVGDVLLGGHGTHVAGTISAEGNNAKGVAGVCWSCSMRFYDYGATSPVKAQVAMVAAVDDGADIVNLSSAFIDNNAKCGAEIAETTLQKVAETNALFRRAILYAERQSKDVLWVFAAGNECRDVKYQSPSSLTANFPLNTIAVASIDPNGSLSSFSNFGNLVTVAAPGGEIFSTLPRTCPISFLPIFCTDHYGPMSGTSMAAPHVSGLAALVRAKHPEFSSTQVKKCILSAAQSVGSSVPGHSFKVINAPKAVECQGTVVLPSKVDMVFSLDLTGSMGSELTRIKTEIATIIDQLKNEVSPSTDFRFGVVSYEDYSGFFDSRSCGSSYADSYGGGSDAPFRISRALTADANAVTTAIAGLTLGGGADGPESYGRVFWELGQDDTGTAIGWRADALKLVVDFGDNLPHDPNLNENVVLPTLLFPDTGVDPGRNNAVDCGGDDIDFQDRALTALSGKGIRLLHIDSSGDPGLAPYWQFWTSVTGGSFAAINSDGSIPGGLNLTDVIVNLLGLIPPSARANQSQFHWTAKMSGPRLINAVGLGSGPRITFMRRRWG